MDTILLVDDNKNHCLLYEQELWFEGYGVSTANDWNKVLNKIKKHPPDLIIVGSCLPEKDRIYELVRLFHNQKYIPIIFNKAFSQYQDHYITRIADACLVKSSDLTELKIKIAELLSKEMMIPTWKY